MPLSQNIVYLTQNNSDNSGSPELSTIRASHQMGNVSGATERGSLSGTFQVKVGDEIRISCSTAPTSSGTWNKLHVTHQETEVQVAISNIEPQYEDYDSCIRINTQNGYGSSATNIPRWSKIAQLVGDAIEYEDSVTLGSSYTIKKNGIFHISFSQNSPTNEWVYASITRNASNLSVAPTSLPVDEVLSLEFVHSGSIGANYAANTAWSGYLSVGDVIRPQTNGSTPLNDARCHFTIAHEGKPSITNVDVTPFADVTKRAQQDINLASTTSSDISYSGTGSPIQLAISKFTSIGSSLVSYEDIGSTTTFTAKVDCVITASLVTNANVANCALAIYKNGSRYMRGSVNGSDGNPSSVTARLMTDDESWRNILFLLQRFNIYT